ncbi:MAG: D-2-hydroxyacid dehydrogenase (NADP+) [Alphaproteobacteria bacterium]|jgi:D-2-hydroxyacid dehydrogenase (NADP+)
MKAIMYTNRRADRIVQFTQEFPDLDWAVVWSCEEFERELAEADLVVLSNRICTPELGAAINRSRTESLKWIHFSSAGIERGVNMGLTGDIPVTTSARAKAPVCAEHAMTLLLASSRRLPELRENQNRHYWARNEMNFTIRSVEEQTLVLIGLGGIGAGIARKAKAFDMRVIAVSRGAPATAHVDEVIGRESLTDALAQADVVVVATASDPSSHHLMNEAAFAAMKETAYFINIARGEIVDEAALIAALQEGRIAGAAIDVAEEEPLAADNPLWDMDNVIISPHVSAAGSMNDYFRLKAIFADNLARFMAGQPLENLFHFDEYRAK